ncbi:MAG: hypothetical protein KGZ25_12495, partial [Planctomycetes bacterium]|nr:hypothetical protein [Planctomycetota bacterium]
EKTGFYWDYSFDVTTTMGVGAKWEMGDPGIVTPYANPSPMPVGRYSPTGTFYYPTRKGKPSGFGLGLGVGLGLPAGGVIYNPELEPFHEKNQLY